jgi:GT2 family glycosyltransferase
MRPDCAPVAVVVVSWNSVRFLPDCLDSLHRLERPPAELWVVDSGSTDGSARVAAERYPRARVVECGENVGFCRANNIGIRSSAAPFVLVLNPDTRLEPVFLERLLPAFEDPRVGIAAGKLLRFDGTLLDSCGQMLARSRQPVDRGYGSPDRGQFDRDEEVFGACGAAALYRRSMLESIADPDGPSPGSTSGRSEPAEAPSEAGGARTYFDEAFFAFYEDLDLAWRARRQGWKAVYRHEAVGYHARGGSARGSRYARRFAAMLGRSPEIRFHIVKNRYLTLLRNDSVAGYLANVPFIWGRDLATLILLLLTSPGVLPRLWGERRRFRRARELRRLDAARARTQFQPGNRE